MKTATIIAASILALALSACVDHPYDGAGLSGASPANFYYKSDRKNADVLLVAAETGNAASWKVSESSYGAATPTAARFIDRAGRPCQGLRHERDGIARAATACQGGDGTWIVAEWAPDQAR